MKKYRMAGQTKVTFLYYGWKRHEVIKKIKHNKFMKRLLMILSDEHQVLFFKILEKGINDIKCGRVRTDVKLEDFCNLMHWSSKS